jgi:hypothetical protein
MTDWDKELRRRRTTLERAQRAADEAAAGAHADGHPYRWISERLGINHETARQAITRIKLSELLARAVAAEDGTGEWDTARAVAALRAAGVEASAAARADEKQAREALRALATEGVLVRVESPANTAVYRRV